MMAKQGVYGELYKKEFLRGVDSGYRSGFKAGWAEAIERCRAIEAQMIEDVGTPDWPMILEEVEKMSEKQLDALIAELERNNDA